jgi:cation efflux system membrane fusion protein
MKAPFLASALVLGTLALGVPEPVRAHVGHGDEFQQKGNVGQVKASAEIDSLLGITTAPATESGGGVTIPAAAVVDAEGKPLVFVKSGATYDPVFIQTGASQGDQIDVTDGSLSPGDNVVTQGALSLYAESRKSQSAAAPSGDGSPPTTTTATPAAAASATTSIAATGPNPLLIGAGAAALVVGGVVVATRLGKKN